MMFFSKTAWSVLVGVVFIMTVRAADVAELRGGEAPQWDKTPVVALSSKRSEMVLNDLWRFMPALGSAEKNPEGQWGWIRVPGAWERGSWDSARYDGLVASGKGGSWEGLKTETPSNSFPVLSLKGVDRAWCEREVSIPADWSGKRIVLDFERVATDAKVFVNETLCGTVSWPGGEVDISAAARPGATNTLRVLVIALGDGKEVLQYMDAHIATKSQAVLKHRGIIGDVVLSAAPIGARIDGLFVKPSVRQQELAVDVELAGLRVGGAVKLEASAVNLKSGQAEKTWTLDLTVPAPDAAGNAVVRDVKLAWEKPELWDYRQPNLYTLKLALKGGGLEDEYAQRFGFREFRIAGRQLLLNERPYNFRLHGLEDNTPIREVIAHHIDGLFSANVNAAEVWPNPDLIRGNSNIRAMIAQVADEKGLPLMIGLSDPTGLFDPADPDVSAAQFSAWEPILKRSWKQLRNSPSAVIFLMAGNRFSHADDQNPLRIGHRKNLDFDAVWKRTKSDPGWKIINAAKALDSTRPVTSHHNANVGDFQTSNNYLNLIPLQEREDWLSLWSQSGDLPFSAVEFDAPFNATMNRGRKGWTGAMTSEPWLTEFLAIYQGPRAYTEEPAGYREMIARTFVSGHDYKGVEPQSAATFRPFGAWWMTRTLRAWRGYGLSGGILHWDNAYGWARGAESESNVRFPPYQAGQRGAYTPRLMRRMVYGSNSQEAMTLTEMGQALVAGYSPTLSWIAGAPGAFTQQDHLFTSGEKIVKSAALLNDTLKPQPYQLEWVVEAAGKSGASGKAEGEVPVGIPTFQAIEFTAPTVTTKSELLLRLKTTLGGTVQEDTFSLRVFPALAALTLKNPVQIFDPEGTTTKWLTGLGVKGTALSAANFTLTPGHLLVIGRNAISRTPSDQWLGLRPQIEKFIQGGGHVLLMGQNPDWMREMSGLRFARYVGRRFWPVPTQTTHPVLVGLDGEDFRDWRGAGSLLDPAPTMDLNRSVPNPPRWGWHLNNTGSVASAAMEKPHLGRWTPLLEGEFDLAFSPLMEARLGQGVLIWCGLDLEGRTAPDPTAELVSRRLLIHLDSTLPPALGETETVYLGGSSGEKLLTSLGLRFTKATTFPTTPSLAIIGAGEEAPSDSALEAFAKNGGRVVLIGAAAAKLGFAVATKKAAGPVEPPTWPEARGLSVSDLRLRTDFSAAVLTEGANEVAAKGLLGRKVVGSGVVIAFPLTPDALPAGEKTYFRFSQWRLTRALSQVLGNLGATFQADADFLNFQPSAFGPIPLAGTWRIKDEALFPGAPSPDKPIIDPGRAESTSGWENEAFNDAAWSKIELPMETEKAMPVYADKDGSFWFRRTFEIPEDYVSKSLLLKLGPVDDFDDVWINGTRIGGTPKTMKDTWSLKREYKIRPGMVRAGINTIAVRCFDQFGGGGFTASSPDLMQIELAKPPVRPAPYVEGFRTDHELGDDYARYYRW